MHLQHTATHYNKQDLGWCTCYITTHVTHATSLISHTCGCACNALQHAATHYNTLQHAWLRWMDLPDDYAHRIYNVVNTSCNTRGCACNTLQLARLRLMDLSDFNTREICNVVSASHLWMRLQHAATRCSMLQHTATHCNTLQRAWLRLMDMSDDYTRQMYNFVNTSCHTRGCACNALQHAATHCNSHDSGWWTCQMTTLVKCIT